MADLAARAAACARPRGPARPARPGLAAAGFVAPGRRRRRRRARSRRPRTRATRPRRARRRRRRATARRRAAARRRVLVSTSPSMSRKVIAPTRGYCQTQDNRGRGLVTKGLALTIEPLNGGKGVRIALRGELDLEHAYTFDEELKRVEALVPNASASICVSFVPRFVRARPAGRRPPPRPQGGAPPRARARARRPCSGSSS